MKESSTEVLKPNTSDFMLLSIAILIDLFVECSGSWNWGLIVVLCSVMLMNNNNNGQ